MPGANVVPVERVIRLARDGATVRAIAARLAISRASVYAVLRQTKEPAK